jgi:hypothetical protein
MLQRRTLFSGFKQPPLDQGLAVSFYETSVVAFCSAGSSGIAILHGKCCAAWRPLPLLQWRWQ